MISSKNHISAKQKRVSLKFTVPTHTYNQRQLAVSVSVVQVTSDQQKKKVNKDYLIRISPKLTGTTCTKQNDSLLSKHGKNQFAQIRKK
jgi:hypothetical protein